MRLRNNAPHVLTKNILHAHLRIIQMRDVMILILIRQQLLLAILFLHIHEFSLYRLGGKGIDPIDFLSLLTEVLIEQTHSGFIRCLHFTMNLRVLRCADFSVFFGLDIAEYHDHDIFCNSIMFLHIFTPRNT